MHEHSLIADLMRKIETLARDHGAGKVSRIRVVLGALSHISPGHFRDHFEEAARGTRAEGAALDIQQNADVHDPHAQDILLESVDVEED